MDSNEMKIRKLIELVHENRKKLKYINLDDQKRYTGWVKSFNIYDKQDENICLDLSREKDLFLLFVLASAWSRPVAGKMRHTSRFT